jgi:hypothetical protein
VLELKLDDSPTDGLGIFLIVHSKGGENRVIKARQGKQQR